MTKALCLLFILPTLAFCQDTFTFPKELLVDPYSRDLKQLKIKQVEQYHSWVWKPGSSLEDLDSSFNIDYIVTFDSLQRVSSFKYDFQQEYGGSLMTGPNGPITIYAHNDSSRLKKLIYDSDTVFFNYYENVFSYNDFGEVEQIRVIRPFRSIIDGVFLAEFPKSKEHTDEFFEDGVLILRKFYRDGELIQTEKFEYKTFKEGDHTIKLLHKVFRDTSSSFATYIVHYQK